ncbi:MAG TPA: tetratricopeptide repeat-containing protein, partial [Thermoanaerobaculia bacterium]|nr:tetratricopeptide repeat-containing protein [Thermoanaerobaculia bacterium]
AESKEDKPAKIGDLALLGREIRDLPWEVSGQRLIGREQFKIQKGAAALETWERVRFRNPLDTEANQWLSTLYQRQGLLGDSDQAIERVLERAKLGPADRAETMALRGRNLESRWTAAWRDEQDPATRQQIALNSAALLESHKAYHDAYLTHLASFFAGINALAMAVVATELAAKHEDTWINSFAEGEEEAAAELGRLKRRRRDLPASIAVSIDASRLGKTETDLWDQVTQGDLAFLRGDAPDKVKAQYARIGKEISPFQVGSVRDQLELFRALGVFGDCAAAALSVLPEAKDTPPPHTLVFTGHRVDAPGRKKPRFPASAVETAKAEIEAVIDAEVGKYGASNVIGIAGAASGGDILFHEALMRRNIESLVYLALPPEDFVRESVKDAGPDWVARFYDLIKARPPRVLQKTADAPEWLPARKDDEFYIWNRNNLWILSRGLANGGANMTLLALWNGEAGDGPGGTEDMVRQADTRGARIVRIGQGTIFPAV